MKGVISNDFKRLSEIFNDIKHRAAYRARLTATAELLISSAVQLDSRL